MKKVLFFVACLALMLSVSKEGRAQSGIGITLLGTADVYNRIIGGELGLSWRKYVVFYGVADNVEFIKESSVYAFDNALYEYSVTGKREIFGVKLILIRANDPTLSSPNEAINIFAGFGRGEIEGDMKINRFQSGASGFTQTKHEKKVKFTLNSFMAGLYAKGMNVALEFRLRYDQASIPIVHEETEEERGESLSYSLLAPEIGFGLAF